MDDRSGKQCRERYVNIVDPEINKEKWTEEEDILLLDLHKSYCNRWVLI